MNKLAISAIKLLQKNAFVARFMEDMYSRIPYVFMNGKALAPLSAVLLLTYRCNLRCKMCFYYNETEKNATQNLISARKNEELTYGQICAFIDDAAGMGVRVLTLHGGEPLVYGDVFKISAYAASKGMLVNFITNGVLLDEKVIDKIIDARINSITISLDGPESAHDDIRGMKGAFKKIVQGIKIFKEKQKQGLPVPRLSVSTYISAMNQSGIMGLFETIRENGIANWGVGLVTYNSEKISAETKKILGISGAHGQGDLSGLPDEIIKLDKKALIEVRDKLKKENSRAGLQIIFPSAASIENYQDPYFNEVNYCLEPWARVVISPYGEVFPCIPLSMVNADMGNIKDEPLSRIWNGKKYVQFRKKIKKSGLLPICSKCCTINGFKSL